MNAYDFDGTVYRGDSSVDFLLFCWKKQPALLRYLPRQGAGFALYAARRIDKTALKERYFSFLEGTDAEGLAREFWDGREEKIYPWYLAQKRPDDVILSASPEFLLRPICERLGVERLIASWVDPATGRFDGPNCRGRRRSGGSGRSWAISGRSGFIPIRKPTRPWPGWRTGRFS